MINEERHKNIEYIFICQYYQSCQKPKHHHDLNPSNTPGNIITLVQLKGEANYDEWGRAIRTTLWARGKWGFVDGNITKPDDMTLEYEDWWTIRSMIILWIMNTIEPKIRLTMRDRETVKDLWTDLKERFSISNGPKSNN